jgi:hypothetical protein
MRLVTYVQNPTDDTVRLMIYKSEEGIYVFGFDDLADNASKWDNLFQDLDEALEFCNHAYNVDNDKWIKIEDPQSNRQHDWIERVRIKGKEKGQPQWGQFEQLINGRWTNGRWTEISQHAKVKSFGGMTGNEKLFIAGLLTALEKSLKRDKVNAEQILRALQWDESSLKKILQ